MRTARRLALTLLMGACPVLLVSAPSLAADEEAEAAEVSAEVVAEEETFAEDGEHSDASHVVVANQHDPPPDPLLTDLDLAVWTGLIFVLMLVLLSQIAWKPILNALKAREENIGGAIEEAQKKLADAEAVLAKHQAELAGAADQVRALLDEARRDADATITKAKEDAKAEFEAERDRATRDIEQAKDAAVRALAERTAGLAIDLAGRVVKQDITPERQSEIVREALGRFSGNGPSAN